MKKLYEMATYDDNEPKSKEAAREYLLAWKKYILQRNPESVFTEEWIDRSSYKTECLYQSAFLNLILREKSN